MERKVDYNLFKTFLAVYELGSLKRAGAKLGISESATSKQITKLSEQLGEALFIRTAKGLEPTFAAQHRVEMIRGAIEQFNLAIPPLSFDAETYTGKVRIALFNSYMQTFGGRLFDLLSKEFPKAYIELVTWGPETNNDIIKTDIQLGVHFYNEDRPNTIYQIPIADDPMVALIGHQHEVPNWEELIRWPFLHVKAAGWSEERYPFLEFLRAKGIELDIQGAVDDASICEKILTTSKLATFMHRSYKTDKVTDVLPSKEYQYSLKTACCISLMQRQAPLQKCLVDIVKSIIK
ncbi:LysR family transcriptional regulator [Thalassotalea crassostreae]|uniref:LysR family transcriptional regulator n=1 Tax=Thalassotalea crassostreae TaxID=1763536 RepID=UPI0008389A22|nr:LysR family transcriptional regulator [Thalassotalea crassostreae]